jgi:DNA-binding MarR family transcriptional regulator
MIPSHLAAILTAARQLKLGQAQLQVLAHLAAHGETTLGHLAERLGITTAGLTGVADTLEARGYALRIKSTTDRRTYLLRLTDAGAAAVRSLTPAAA